MHPAADLLLNLNIERSSDSAWMCEGLHEVIGILADNEKAEAEAKQQSQTIRDASFDIEMDWNWPGDWDGRHHDIV